MKKHFRLLALLIAISGTALHGAMLFAADDLEGVTWHLVELNGAAPAPLPGGKQLSIMFDANKKSAAGYNGCNNYFGQYELQGQSLKFGPIASTRRACPEAQSNIETKFMAALEKTNSWEIKGGTLILLDGTNAFARFTIK